MAKYLTENPYYYNTMFQRIFNMFRDYEITVFEKGLSFFDENVNINQDFVFKEFERRIITKYDTSNDNSLSKYSRQLEGASLEVRHYFASIVWLYHFFIRNESKLRKTKVNEVYYFLNESVSLALVDKKTPEEGIISYGNLFHSKYYDINFIHFLLKKYLTTNKIQIEIIDELDLIKEMQYHSVENFDEKTTLPSQHLLKYAFNPDYYEPIGAREHKQKIVTYFLGSFDNERLDEDLYLIRNSNNFDKSYYDIIEDLSALPKKARDNKSLKDAILFALYQLKQPSSILEITKYINENGLFDYGNEKYIEAITKVEILKHSDNEERVDSKREKLFRKVDKDRFFVINLIDDALAPDENEFFGENEGKVKQVTINTYERSRKNRAKCLKEHGCKCSVCGIDFGIIYGDRGHEFIHVHHIKPLGEIKEEYKIDPKKDLLPLCPNCHSMIHRYKDTLSIDKLKEMISAKYLKIMSTIVEEMDA